MCESCFYQYSLCCSDIVIFHLQPSQQCLCVCSGLIPHVLGEVLFLWCCNLLAHFINTYAVDESVSLSPLPISTSFDNKYNFIIVLYFYQENYCMFQVGTWRACSTPALPPEPRLPLRLCLRRQSALIFHKAKKQNLKCSQNAKIR